METVYVALEIFVMHLLTKEHLRMQKENGCYLGLEDDVVATIFGFEPGTTINNSLLTSPYLSLSLEPANFEGNLQS